VLDLSRVNFEKGGGLVTVVAQDARSGAVLMVAHADREALERTLATGEMHYRSRSRGLWRKGETSGNVQRVASLSLDCDGDAVLARVLPAGPACHTGAVSCFGEEGLVGEVLGALDRTIAARWRSAESARGTPPEQYDALVGSTTRHHFPPEGTASAPASSRPSYTEHLFGDRNLRLKKLGEEMAELVTACADADRTRAAEEGADVLYHTLVALRAVGVTLADVRQVLSDRAAPPNLPRES
jgi:phosphoribosyl-AMP cyclohydrolase / phosphoribosyl-ATP pyrophosphohydrolase